MTVLSKIIGVEKLNRNQSIVVACSAVSLGIWTLNIYKRMTSRRPSQGSRDELDLCYDSKQSKEKKNKLKNDFNSSLAQVRKTLTMVMGPTEYCYALGIALSLIMRTVCDLWLINNGTMIESGIINADMKKLQYNIGTFFLCMPSLALVNNSIKFFMNQLRLNIRYKLSSLLYNRYVEGLTYYRINVLDSSVQNIDQLLTNDVEKFSSALVDVYTNVAKPLLDVVILVQRMSITYTGAATPASMMGYLAFAGTILTIARRPLTAFTVKETQLEGQLRYVHSRLITNCEEIAFYQGNNREKMVLMNALDKLRNHLFDASLFKFNIDFLDNMIAKYFATVVGYLSLAIPFLGTRYATDSQSMRLETYYKSGRMMVKLAESLGRLLLAGREFSRLSAYSQRVGQLVHAIENNRSSKLSLPANNAISSPIRPIPGAGIIEYCDPEKPIIQFINVPLCTPNGDILVQSLNVTIQHGQNVIVTGPNGSGKSSLFRLLGELWPLHGGKLIKPRSKELFYIPQKPYLTLGSFRDQLIYPDTVADMRRKGINEDHLAEILHKVELSYLLERESFDSVQDWQEVLSGGEKQRVAIGRLIYHRPLYAILDECTSAVSVDVEQRVYKYLTEEVGCSLLSVSHRVKQLAAYHSFILRFDGNGDATYSPLDVEKYNK
ncbi:ATP-binding cassette sub-family D member 3 [Halotydeus destructor]|nr:ATP-binding cassette sub-family D member 3 [Halotydeus destructor]